MMSSIKDGRVPDGTGHSSQATEPKDGLGGSRFDPSRMDDTDWHVLAQDISNHWPHPEERAVAYQAAAEAIKLLRAELERRDENERRNCLNWGPSRPEYAAADFPCANPARALGQCSMAADGRTAKCAAGTALPAIAMEAGTGETRSGSTAKPRQRGPLKAASPNPRCPDDVEQPRRDERQDHSGRNARDVRRSHANRGGQPTPGEMTIGEMRAKLREIAHLSPPEPLAGAREMLAAVYKAEMGLPVPPAVVGVSYQIAIKAIERAFAAHPTGRAEALEEVARVARLMPRATPAAGGSGTIHSFEIEASTVWANDLALKRLDAALAPEQPAAGEHDD